MSDSGVVETIYEIGFGSEARVLIELRTRFEGIGGAIITQEGVATCLRIEHDQSEKSGHRLFFRHSLIKKLDDYFYRKGKYHFPHVPRPLGSISSHEGGLEAYAYEWAPGWDDFPWCDTSSTWDGAQIPLRDWNQFVENFNVAGIGVGYDICHSDDANRSKNIIHQCPQYVDEKLGRCSLWKRIDFGYRSLPMDEEKLQKFLTDQRDVLIRVLGDDRYRFMTLAAKFLCDSQSLSALDIRALVEATRKYRQSSLRHCVAAFGVDELPTIEDLGQRLARPE